MFSHNKHPSSSFWSADNIYWAEEHVSALYHTCSHTDWSAYKPTHYFLSTNVDRYHYNSWCNTMLSCYWEVLNHHWFDWTMTSMSVNGLLSTKPAHCRYPFYQQVSTYRFWPPSATVVSAEPFSHGTGTLRCLQKEMATYRHWSVSLWRDSDDVPHCQILSPDKTEWRLISVTLCRWRRCFVADQLWFMTRIREEEEED